eukprot:424915-Prorocentrum_minimum.AAC.1
MFAIVRERCARSAAVTRLTRSRAENSYSLLLALASRTLTRSYSLLLALAPRTGGNAAATPRRRLSRLRALALVYGVDVMDGGVD